MEIPFHNKRSFCKTSYLFPSYGASLYYSYAHSLAPLPRSTRARSPQAAPLQFSSVWPLATTRTVGRTTEERTTELRDRRSSSSRHPAPAVRRGGGRASPGSVSTAAAGERAVVSEFQFSSIQCWHRWKTIHQRRKFTLLSDSSRSTVRCVDFSVE